MKLSCNRKTLLESLQIADAITPKKTSKPILKNVKLEASGGQVKITATNIELTMKRTIDVDSVGEEGTVLMPACDLVDILKETGDSDDVFIFTKDIEKRILVPIQTLRTLASIIDVSEDDVITIKMGDNHVVFKDSSTEIISQLIEGRFPEYKNYISNEYEFNSIFNKSKLLSGIRKAKIMTSQETSLVKFSFVKEDKKLNMLSHCIDRGSSEVSTTIESMDGDDITVGFNANHIIDVLRVINEDEVSWSIKDQGAGEISEGEDFRYIFMPIKTK